MALKGGSTSIGSTKLFAFFGSFDVPYQTLIDRGVSLSKASKTLADPRDHPWEVIFPNVDVRPTSFHMTGLRCPGHRMAHRPDVDYIAGAALTCEKPQS